MLEPDVDHALVKRAQAGDSLAFDMLVVKYQDRVCRLIQRWVRQPETAQDLTQETFINVYRGLGSFRGDSKFYTWVYRIAINTAKRGLKRPAQGAEQSLDDVETFQLEADSNPLFEVDNANPETELASKQLAEAVARAMAELPDDMRQALELRELEGMSYQAIAEVMGSPLGTVRSRIFRAREWVAERVQPMLEHRSGKRW
ncbi:MAG: sigma-70 family RNA polymerase sigma factor [Burkholderiaceae bacterium]|jgi:RNA polymerase sigma-70 factor (ECF subfamily)|nr:sigma-70 family RNA polymerase sigma factor [Candidatus Fonsibacter lacus]